MKKYVKRTNQKPTFPFSATKIVLAVLFIMIFCINFSSAIIIESFTTGDDEGWELRNFDNAMTFTLGTTGVDEDSLMDFINMSLYRKGSPGITYVEIREVDVSGNPNGTVISRNATFNGNTLSTNAAGVWTVIQMPDVFLSASTTYAIVFNGSASADASNTVGTRLDSGNGYAGGSWWASTDNEITWTADGARDAMFEVVGVSGTVDVVLVAPADSLETTDSELIFNASLSLAGGNLTNATLFLWNSTDDIFNQTLNPLSNTTNTSQWLVANIVADTYNWNVLGCGINSSEDDVCTFATSNRTFERKDFVVITNTFTNDVFETDSERFELNISTVDTVLSVSANLIYNSTSFAATSSCNATGFCTISRTIDIPFVTSGGSQNKSFLWEVTVFEASDQITSNTSALEQNVSAIFFNVCSATLSTITLNFTTFDEQSGVQIEPFYIAGEFEFWLGSGSLTKPLSFINLSTNEETLCIFPPERNFSIEDTIEYNDEINSSTYDTRNYYFQQDVINNVTRHIPLFLLESDDSTSFILKVQDTNLLPISEALIIIQRLNVGTGNFSTVHIAKTDDNGQTVGFFKTETVDYRFIIVRNGVTLLTTVPQKVVPETAPFTLTFTVGIVEDAPWKQFEDLELLDQTLEFDRSTSIVSFTYVDTSGNFTLGRLLVVNQNLSGTDSIICNVNSTQSSAVLTCDVSNVTGTYIASGFITRDSTETLVNQIIFKVQSFSDVAGLYGVFLAWFIILISAFAFKFNEIAGIVLMNLSVFFVNVIGLVNFGFLFIFGMIGVSILIIVLLKK